MKKTLFILLIFSLVSGAYAQKINLFGGMSLSKYISEWVGSGPEPIGPVWRYDNITGFLGGIGIEFEIIKGIKLEADGLYFQKEGSNSVQPGAEIIYNLNTLSFPALIKLAFLPDSFPYILAGGEYSIILSHKRDGSDLADSPTKGDWGIILGVGNNIKIPGALFFVEARYHIGLSGIDLTDETIELDDVKRQTRALAVIIGVKI